MTNKLKVIICGIVLWLSYGSAIAQVTRIVNLTVLGSSIFEGSVTFSVPPTVASGISGTTAQRPSAPQVGQSYFDTTIGLPIWCQSTGPSVWVNSAGATV